MSASQSSTPVARPLCAVSVVRNGTLASGTAEACAEAGGVVVLIGSGLDPGDESANDISLLQQLPGAEAICLVASDDTDPRRLAEHLAPLLRGSIDFGGHAVALPPSREPMLLRSVDLGAHDIVLPASPDGRDLAPFLAEALGATLLAGAIQITDTTVSLARVEGQVIVDYPRNADRSVITLLPGQRGTSALRTTEHVRVIRLAPTEEFAPKPPSGPPAITSLGVLPPDAATIDLTEAPRIVAGGQGLGSTERFEQLARIGAQLGASLGGTRVASDAGWIPFERQIGTTGVMVNPRLYLSFAISGATQHTSGLGDPDHIISVNLDASCPMMAMSDLAIVSDANAVLDELERLLSRRGMRPVEANVERHVSTREETPQDNEQGDEQEL